MLIVDDDRVVVDTLCALLAARGFEVAGACSAEAAMDLVEGGLAPDVLLTDLNMPGRSGEDLADSVRAEPRCEGTAIVAMSACSRALAGAQLKTDSRLLKPFELPALLQALAHAWAAHRRIR